MAEHKGKVPWAAFAALSLGMIVFGLAESYGPVSVASGIISSKYAWLGYSLPYIFGGIGAMMAGYLTDKLGRKRAFLLTSGLIILGLILFIPVYFYHTSSPTMLGLAIISMALVGMAAIGLETPVLVTIAESVESRYRGKLLVLAQNFGNVGVALAFVPLLLVHGKGAMNLQSKVALFMMYVAPVAALIISWLKTNETLPWRAVRKQEIDVEEAWRKLDSSAEEVKPTVGIKARIAILLALGISQDVAFVYMTYGVSYIYFYNASFLGIDVTTLIPMAGGFIMTAVGILAGLFLTERVSRRTFAVASFSLLSLLWAILMATAISSGMAFTALVFFVYALLFIPLELTWAARAMLEPELFPTKKRGTYISLVRMTVWLITGGITGAMSFLPSLTSSFLAGAGLMLAISLVGVGAAIAWKLMGFETKGKNLLGLDLHKERAVEIEEGEFGGKRSPFRKRYLSPLPFHFLVISLYGWRARIGLLIPSSNTTMEPEFWELAPYGVSIHTARMPLKEVTPEALEEMEKESLRGAKLLADAGVDIIMYGCTSGSLIKGIGYDQEISEKLSKESKKKVITTSTAVISALKEVKAEKICVATPYIEEVNSKEKEFLEGNGFEVIEIKGLGIKENLEIGRQPPWAAYRLAKEVYSEDADALFISCTNFRTLEVLEALEEDLGIPVISSNSASMWLCLKELGIREEIEGFGYLLSSLSLLR